ncbi:mtN3/saliva family protein [Oesophagostomum dentatum]|uniref:Sugar transporter SWEET1 n=1 Tax=Oesophagostomum dentatum TaxID=61180 RepID=A0A0B1S6L7_OESDE|nr:mtN3/saliva family protein [Oesophagostomum dentatum]
MDLQVFLQFLSCCAIITTIALFLCGIPICLEIMRRKGTKDISGVPFLMGLLGGSFWLRYGFLKDDSTMIIVNLVSVALFSIYCLFYLAFATPRVRSAS